MVWSRMYTHMSQKLEHGSYPRNRMTVDFFIAVTTILNMSPRSVIYTYQRFGGTCYTYIQGSAVMNLRVL